MNKKRTTLHLAIHNMGLIRKMSSSLSKRFNVVKWGSADLMINSGTIQENDIAVVDEFWAAQNKSALEERSTPLFIVLLPPMAGPGSATLLANRAVELMEDGAVECLTEQDSPQNWESVIEFVAGAHWAPARDGMKPSASGFPMWAAITIFIALTFGSTLFFLTGRENSHVARERYYHVPIAHPSGIAVHKDNVLICDWYSQSINVFKARHELEPLQHIKFDQFSPISICWAQDKLWSLGNDGRIRSHPPSKGYLADSTHDLGGLNVVGLSWDGRHFWTCDAVTRNLLKLNIGETFEVLEQYPTGVVEPVGLVATAHSCWIMDGKSGEVFHYKIRPGGVDLADRKKLQLFDNTEFNQAAGFGGDGGTLWVGAEKSGVLYRFEGKND